MERKLDESWRVDAACRTVDPNIFFPKHEADSAIAKLICNECVVRVPCLEYAIETGENFGVWGGASEGERRALVRNQRQRGA